MVFKLEIENYLPKAKRNEAQWWISLHPLIPSHFPLMVEWVSAKLIYFFNPHFSLKNQSLLLFLNRYIVLFNKSHESILRSISYGSNSIYVSLAGLNVFHGSHGGLTSLVTSLGLRVTFDLNFRSDRKSAGAKFLISDLQWWESDITINYWSYDLKKFPFYYIPFVLYFFFLAYL